MRSLGEGRWGLDRARQTAAEIKTDRRAVKALVRAMFQEEPELRKRATDVARRITETDSTLLRPFADELAGLLADLGLEESRTRWHLGLVVARVAHTRMQRLRAARLMELLFEDESNVVRCSAIEGVSVLACDEPSVRAVAAEIIARALYAGTPAMKARARHAKKRLERIPKFDSNLGPM